MGSCATADNSGPDQPALMRGLIRAFVVRLHNGYCCICRQTENTQIRLHGGTVRIWPDGTVIIKHRPYTVSKIIIIKKIITAFVLVSSGWLGEAKVFCSRFCHRGVQLILAYSWARPVVLAGGKITGVMLLFLLFVLFLSFPSSFPIPLFSSPLSLLCLFSLSLGHDTKWPTRVDVSLNPNTVNQYLPPSKVRQNVASTSMELMTLHRRWCDVV